MHTGNWCSYVIVGSVNSFKISGKQFNSVYIKPKIALVLISLLAFNTHNNLSIMQLLCGIYEIYDNLFFSFGLINIKVHICVGKGDRKYMPKCYHGNYGFLRSQVT